MIIRLDINLSDLLLTIGITLLVVGTALSIKSTQQ